MCPIDPGAAPATTVLFGVRIPRWGRYELGGHMLYMTATRQMGKASKTYRLKAMSVMFFTQYTTWCCYLQPLILLNSS